MKKQLLLAAIATILATTTMAQTEIGVGPKLSSFIPAEFTTDNQSKLISIEELSDDNEGHVYVFKFYDYGFTMTHQLTILPRPYYYIRGFNIIDLDDRGREVGLTLTQTLFNNDENYEYVVVNRNYTGFVSEASIVSENGTTIWSWQPSGNNQGNIYFIKWNNLYYICTEEISYYDQETDIDTYTWYRIDRQTQSISRVEGELPINVFPSVADRSQTITVELGEGNNATEVQVVNALGQVVKTVPIQAGQREVQLRANDLDGGMHIIGTRTHEGQGACKIIIK